MLPIVIKMQLKHALIIIVSKESSSTNLTLTIQTSNKRIKANS